MNAAQAKKLSLYELLNSLGHSPAETRKGGNEVWYKSPFRMENDASFKIKIDENVWYDFGEGEGGNILDFVMKLQNCSFSEALLYLGNSSLRSSSISFSVSKSPKVEALDMFNLQSPLILDVKPVYHFALKEYLKNRCIAPAVAFRHLKEINYKVGESTYFALGFANNANGWEVRSPIFKGCIGNKDISTIESGSDAVKVYEGFMDFLSDITLNNVTESKDVVVLNSTSMRHKAIQLIKDKRYKQVDTYFDNDKGGRMALEVFNRELEGILIRAMNHMYEPYNDLNDHLIRTGKRQVS